MFTRAALICLFALLTGCDTHSATSQKHEVTSGVAAAPTEGGRPVLIAAGLDVVPLISNSGTPWRGDPFDEQGSHNASVDLTRRNTFYRGGSITVDRASMGGIYMIRVASGVGDRCGDPAPLKDALLNLVGPLGLDRPSDADLASFDSAWRAKNGLAEINLGGRSEVRAIGGCLPSFTIKAV